MKAPSYATAVVGAPEIIEGILEEPKAPCCEGCGGLNGVEDLLQGSAGKGASVGAAVGSVIPGVGTVIGGAVGAVAGAVSDLFSGSKHCEVHGHEVPCPPCGITDLECFKKWAIAQQQAASPQVRKAALDAVRRIRVPAAPHPQPKPVQVRRASPPKPIRVTRPVRPMQPMSIEARENPEPASSAMPLMLGVAALLAAGGGAWWLWRKHTSEAER